MEDFDWSEYQEENVLDEVLDSWPYKNFKKKFFNLRFIGYDYNPTIYDGSKVYTFMDCDGNILKVFNTLGIPIDQIEEHREGFRVILKKHGYYEFQNIDSLVADNKATIIAFEDEWLRYEDAINKRRSAEETEKKGKEIQRQMDRNADRFPYDLSGEDLSRIKD